VARCLHCTSEVDGIFRFCPWCAAPLRSKLVEFFPAWDALERDEGKALRVSRYLAPEPEARHVRFSVWDATGTVEGAVSLGDAEAERLARFLLPPPQPQTTATSLVEQLRSRIGLS
jgi:hypothetical protein